MMKLTFLETGIYRCASQKDSPIALDGFLQQKGCEECPVFSSCKMSHWTAVDVDITDIDALRLAANELRLVWQEGIAARGWAGELLPCEYSLRFPGKFDVAIVKDGERYKLVTDWWDGSVAKVVGKDFGRLVQLYGVNKAMAAARKKGYNVLRENQENGEIQVKVSF